MRASGAPIVGASAGGGYDTQARLVARHLGKHVPGNPTIIVQNMPGAGSLAATNYIHPDLIRGRCRSSEIMLD
jgi:tripartite-type tricarboxylate transporter receptor subunit TctC